MNISTTTRSGRRSRSIAAALTATMALVLPGAVLAQEPAESPAASPATEAAASPAASPATEAAASPAASPATEAASTGIAFPVMLGGQLLSAESYTGPEWLARFPEDPAYVQGTEALVERVGSSIEDLTVTSALYEPVPGQPAVVAAVQVAGVDAREWVEEAVDLMVADIVEPGLVLRPLGTKWTLRVTDASMPGVYPRTVYLQDDVAWIIQGDNDLVWDALSQLPEPEPVGLSSADSLYTDVPVALGGQRRIGLYESTEPLFLPTLGERLGEGIEKWLLDLYLEAGISPAEMLGVITWWGLEAAQDGIQIEGYRLPEGGEELTQRLLEDVLLARPPEAPIDSESPAAEFDELSLLLEGVTFSEEEVAGQAVTILDYGSAKQYMYSSADTIWVISDPLGEADKVEEAIRALPQG